MTPARWEPVLSNPTTYWPLAQLAVLHPVKVPGLGSNPRWSAQQRDCTALCECDRNAPVPGVMWTEAPSRGWMESVVP